MVNVKNSINHREKMSVGEGYSITVAGSVEEVESFRSVWESMDPSPYAHIDYFLAMVTSRKKVIRPNVFLLSKEGKPEMILAAMLEESVIQYKMGYKVLMKIPVRSLTIFQGGVIGNETGDNCAALVSELLHFLKGGEAEIVSIRWVPVDSNMYKAAREIPHFLVRDHFPISSPRWIVQLPTSLEEFYKGRSRNFRKGIYRMRRHLERDYPGKTGIKIYREQKDIGTFLTEAGEISKKTYQHALGAGIENNDATYRLMSILAEKGWFHGTILYIEDKPCAFDSGLIYKDINYLDSAGYDPGYKEYDIGSILFQGIIDDLIVRKKAKTVDLGPGDGFFKRRYGSYSYDESDLFIFSPTAKGISLNLLRILFGGIHTVGDNLLGILKLRETYNKYKRKRSTIG